jgi:hypothetical protein
MVNRHLSAHIVLQRGHKAVPQWGVGETMSLREFLTFRSGLIPEEPGPSVENPALRAEKTDIQLACSPPRERRDSLRSRTGLRQGNSRALILPAQSETPFCCV